MDATNGLRRGNSSSILLRYGMTSETTVRRKLKRADCFATFEADVAVLTGNAKPGAQLAPAHQGRTRASTAAARAARGARGAPGGRRVGAPQADVNAAHGAEHAPAEQRVGAPQAAVNAVATEGKSAQRPSPGA